MKWEKEMPPPDLDEVGAEAHPPPAVPHCQQQHLHSGGPGLAAQPQEAPTASNAVLSCWQGRRVAAPPEGCIQEGCAALTVFILCCTGGRGGGGEGGEGAQMPWLLTSRPRSCPMRCMCP